MTKDIVETIFIIVAVMVFICLTLNSIKYEYNPKLDEIYDEKGQKLLILWYNKIKGSKIKREYKVLMKL